MKAKVFMVLGLLIAVPQLSQAASTSRKGKGSIAKLKIENTRLRKMNQRLEKENRNLWEVGALQVKLLQNFTFGRPNGVILGDVGAMILPDLSDVQDTPLPYHDSATLQGGSHSQFEGSGGIDTGSPMRQIWAGSNASSYNRVEGATRAREGSFIPDVKINNDTSGGLGALGLGGGQVEVSSSNSVTDLGPDATTEPSSQVEALQSRIAELEQLNRTLRETITILERGNQKLRVWHNESVEATEDDLYVLRDLPLPADIKWYTKKGLLQLYGKARNRLWSSVEERTKRHPEFQLGATDPTRAPTGNMRLEPYKLNDNTIRNNLHVGEVTGQSEPGQSSLSPRKVVRILKKQNEERKPARLPKR